MAALDQWLHVRLPDGMLDTFESYARERRERGVSSVVRKYLDLCADLSPEELEDLLGLGRLCLTAAERVWEKMPEPEKSVLREVCVSRAWTAEKLHLLPAYLETLPLEALSVGTRETIKRLDRGALWGLKGWALMHPAPGELDAEQEVCVDYTCAANGISGSRGGGSGARSLDEGESAGTLLPEGPG